MSGAKHWSYGSGMSGCLYDNGPHFTETLTDAVDGALLPFLDVLTDSEERLARRALRFEGIYYFEAPETAGAQYVEVCEQDGPCPDSDA